MCCAVALYRFLYNIFITHLLETTLVVVMVVVVDSDEAFVKISLTVTRMNSIITYALMYIRWLMFCPQLDDFLYSSRQQGQLVKLILRAIAKYSTPC